MSSVNKQYCVIYDTFKDIFNDDDITKDMVVMTLGYNTIDDGEGCLYKIITKEEKGIKDIPGEYLSNKSPYYAMAIKSFVSIDSIIKKSESLVSKLNNNIKEIANISNNNYEENYDALQTTSDMMTTSQLFNIYYLNEEETIKVVQCFNGDKFIVNTEEDFGAFYLSFTISEETEWMIPTEFILTDYMVSTKTLSDNSYIKLEDDTLIFRLDFTELDRRAIQY